MPRPKRYEESASIHIHLEKADKEAFADWCHKNKTTMADAVREFIYDKIGGRDRNE
jgi:hypothetical protein